MRRAASKDAWGLGDCSEPRREEGTTRASGASDEILVRYALIFLRGCVVRSTGNVCQVLTFLLRATRVSGSHVSVIYPRCTLNVGLRRSLMRGVGLALAVASVGLGTWAQGEQLMRAERQATGRGSDHRERTGARCDLSSRRESRGRRFAARSGCQREGS